MKFCTIDPGYLTAGIAIYAEPRKYLAAWEEKFIGSTTAWVLDDVFFKIRHTLKAWNVEKVYCEEPRYFKETAAKTNALTKLCFAYGATRAAASSLEIEFEAIPLAWKGTIPDSAVMARANMILYGKTHWDENIKSHSGDAIAIGLFVKGLWK